jgi:hypothetical protein
MTVRQELPPPSEDEQKLYAIIDRGYEKMDTAARAASRYLHDKLEELRQLRLDDGLDELEAGDLTKTFNEDDFIALFWRYAQLTIDEDLIKFLELDNYRDQIMQLRIREVFGSTPEKQQVVVAQGQQDKVFVGSDSLQALHALRKNI